MLKRNIRAPIESDVLAHFIFNVCLNYACDWLINLYIKTKTAFLKIINMCKNVNNYEIIVICTVNI